MAQPELPLIIGTRIVKYAILSQKASMEVATGDRLYFIGTGREGDSAWKVLDRITMLEAQPQLPEIIASTCQNFTKNSQKAGMVRTACEIEHLLNFF